MPQVFYSAWKALEGASVPTGEQILVTNLCRDKRELRGSGFHLSRSTTACHMGREGSREGGSGVGTWSRSRTESAATYDCSVNGEGDPVQQGASKSVVPVQREGGDSTINT